MDTLIILKYVEHKLGLVSKTCGSYIHLLLWWLLEFILSLSFPFLVFPLGSLCNYILPKALKTSAVRHDPNFQGYDIEKKRLTRSFSCFSSISMHQRERQVSISSLFLHSQYKGCLPPWELKKSRNGSSKEE